MILDWNRERHRTRDRLLDWDITWIPSIPSTQPIPAYYPWPEFSLGVLAQQLFALASRTGYSGTESDFVAQFGSFFYGKQLVMDYYENFPETGDTDKLYFDLEEKILYYWDSEYLPVNATLIADSIIDGGNSIG